MQSARRHSTCHESRRQDSEECFRGSEKLGGKQHTLAHSLEVTASSDLKNSNTRCESEGCASLPFTQAQKEFECSEACIIYAIALLKKLGRTASIQDSGNAVISAEEVQQIFDGLMKAVRLSTSGCLDEHAIKEELQGMFDSHAHVFDDKVKSFLLQTYLHEIQSESVKSFQAALRRDSLVRHCLIVHNSTKNELWANKLECRFSTFPTKKCKGAICRSELVMQVVDNGHPVANKLKDRNQREASYRSMYPSLQQHTINRMNNALQHADAWEFDIFELADAVPNQVFCIVGRILFERYSFSQHLQTSRETLEAFLLQAQKRYHPKPYHNATHAADVAQTLHHFFVAGGLDRFFTSQTLCVAILAAIVHDIGHTGYSNHFHTARNDDLAVRYIYRSPLEHLHCATSFEILRLKDCNILQKLPNSDQMRIRNLMTDMILATDNSVHSVYLDRLERLIRREKTFTHPNTIIVESDRSEGLQRLSIDNEKLMLQMALHAADVSNPAKAFHTYEEWYSRILEEFYQQGDEERKIGLQISAGYDRYNPIPVAKMQAGFIIGVVRPLFQVFAQLPQLRILHCLMQLDQNLETWQQTIQSD